MQRFRPGESVGGTEREKGGARTPLSVAVYFVLESDPSVVHSYGFQRSGAEDSRTRVGRRIQDRTRIWNEGTAGLRRAGRADEARFAESAIGYP